METTTGTPSKNLMECLQEELTRCREVLKLYEEIPQGAFGAMMIRLSIKTAEDSINKLDVVKMIAAYQDLKEIE